MQNATFSVRCLPGAPIGVAQCGACITEGSIVTRLSFRIEVAETGQTDERDDKTTAVVKELGITVDEEMRTDAVVMGRSLPTTPEDAPGKRIRVRRKLNTAADRLWKTPVDNPKGTTGTTLVKSSTFPHQDILGITAYLSRFQSHFIPTWSVMPYTLKCLLSTTRV